MEKKAKITLKGGYECLFVEDPPKYLQTECSVCLCILEEPHIIDCECSACCCRSCIDPIKAEGKPCPLCKSPFTTSIPDRRLQRTLNGLQVYCTYRELGCEWMGKLGLGKLYQHLNLDNDPDRFSGCPFVSVKCSFCKTSLRRQEIEKHETDQCTQRPFQCVHCNEYKSTFQDVTCKHISVCPEQEVECPEKCGFHSKHKNIDKHLINQCPLSQINCPFHSYGCMVKLPRKDMPSHITDNLSSHVFLQQESMLTEFRELKSQHSKVIEELEQSSVMLNEFRELKTQHSKVLEELEQSSVILNEFHELKAQHSKVLEELEKSNALVRKLEREIDDLKLEQLSIRSHFKVLPIRFFLTDFAAKKRNELVWSSPPFYSHPQGYKFCFEVYPSGYGKGKGTYISAFVHLMRGEFDNQLKWPFRGKIVIYLLDQESKGETLLLETDFSDRIADHGAGRRIRSEKMDLGWGSHKCFSLGELQPKYLKNDVLYLKVSS